MRRSCGRFFWRSARPTIRRSFRILESGGQYGARRPSRTATFADRGEFGRAAGMVSSHQSFPVTPLLENAMSQPTPSPWSQWPDPRGRFGEFGGRYIPETLVDPIDELERAYDAARADETFHAELRRLLRSFAGRPTPLFHARRLSQQLGGAEVYLKREDLLHTGAHKINNCLGKGCSP